MRRAQSALGRHLDALSADLSSDGVLDGRGERGQPLELAVRALGPATLRADLGRALLAFVDSSTTSALSAARSSSRWPRHWLPIRASCSRTASRSRSTTIRRSFGGGGSQKAEVPADRPLRGAVELVIEMADASAIDRVILRGGGVDAQVEQRTLARFPINTRSLADGPNSIELVGIDEHGNEARVGIGFEVDNAAPILTVAEIGKVAGSTVTIAGAVEDRTNVEVRARIGSWISAASVRSWAPSLSTFW